MMWGRVGYLINVAVAAIGPLQRMDVHPIEFGRNG
jgi:hypothetical protein